MFRRKDGQVTILVTQAVPMTAGYSLRAIWSTVRLQATPRCAKVKEETGVDARIVERVGTIRYVFRARGRQVAKTALFYLMEYAGGNTNDESPEVRAVLWCRKAR